MLLASGGNMATSEQKTWVERAFGIALSAANPGLVVWRQERAAANTRLRSLATAIGGSGDPEARDAIILLQAIIKNLTAEPTSAAQVAELKRWLETDDILEDAEAPNPFGIEVAVRAPLLAALAGLRVDN